MKKAYKNILLVLLSLGLAAVICQNKGDDWEEKVRTAFYRATNDSITNYTKTIVDEKGVPYVHYAAYKGINAGDEYNPTIVANYAIDYYKLIEEKNDSATKDKFLHCINWLVDNITYKDHYALYEFNWKQPFYDSVGVPWTSGMSSGRAIEALTGAYKLYHSQKYIEYATALLRGFYQPIQSGGFTYKESLGYWYEEFADSNMHTPRVLDGHIYAFLGVQKFWVQTKSDSAGYLVKQGISSLKGHLPGYDMDDGWSYYDAYHIKSDKKYHTLLTGLMKELWEITNDPVFNSYYHKWNAPLIKPYIYRIIKEKNRSGLLLYFLMSSCLFTVLSIGSFVIGRKYRKGNNPQKG